MNLQMVKWESVTGVRFLKKIGLEKGFKVLDFGAGTGHYTLPISKIIGKKGQVYALDKNGDKLNELRNKAKKSKLINIKIVKTDGKLSTTFNDDTFDVVLLYDILHFFKTEERISLYKEVKRISNHCSLLSVYPKHTNNDLPSYELKNKSINEIRFEIEESGFKFKNKICDIISHDDSLNEGCILNFINC